MIQQLTARFTPNGSIRYNPEGSSGTAYFFWGTSPNRLNSEQFAGNLTADYTAQPFSYSLIGLQTNTTYYYQMAFTTPATASRPLLIK